MCVCMGVCMGVCMCVCVYVGVGVYFTILVYLFREPLVKGKAQYS